MAIRRQIIIPFAIGVVVTAAVIAGTWTYLSTKRVSAPVKTDSSVSTTPELKEPASQQIPKGTLLAVGDAFHVTVPNGWRASVSTQSSFVAVQFARPSQIDSLVYNPDSPAAIDYNGIPAWSGLTEHFYIRAITTASAAFNPANHAETTAEEFAFTDGTVGTKYLVTKHAAEAKKWGGLLKDDVWYGRVFRYEKGGKIIEAHLAYYPSTRIDTAFFEQVAKSITL